MKKLSTLLLPFMLLIGCKDKDITKPNDPNHPEMIYTDLHNLEVKKDQRAFLDLDKDGFKDLLFSTLLVGDAINKVDKLKYYVMSAEKRLLLSSQDDRTPVYSDGDKLPLHNKDGYEWNEVLWIVLAEKITGINKPPFWTGDWKNAAHKFIAVQVVKNNDHYCGWVEISFDTAGEKIILHKAAISREAGKEVVAGV